MSKARGYLTKAKQCEERGRRLRDLVHKDWQMTLARAHRMLAAAQSEAAGSKKWPHCQENAEPEPRTGQQRCARIVEDGSRIVRHDNAELTGKALSCLYRPVYISRRASSEHL